MEVERELAGWSNSQRGVRFGFPRRRKIKEHADEPRRKHLGLMKSERKKRDVKRKIAQRVKKGMEITVGERDQSSSPH